MATNSKNPTLQDDYMVGPTSEIRIKTQICLLSLLLIFGIIDNGVMLILFARFKSLRRVYNYLLIDFTIVGFLDIVVNIPIFMEFFLLTKKKNLERQTRWYAMLFHRYFLLNDLFTQISQAIDCFLAIKFGKQFTSKKTSNNIKAFIAFKWLVILVMLLMFMVPNYTIEEEYVSDEAYQRLLFGPNQVIWKIIIPSCQLFAVVAILMTNRLIKNSRNLVSKRYGMRTFGRGSKNSSKAVNTLTLIMVVQTLCKVPAAVYSYVAVDDRVEGNRWFAFFSYFFLFTSSSVMPLIYFWRTVAFRRTLTQFRKHPFARNAYLDYAAQHGLTSHRNGRLHLDPKILKRKRKASPKPKKGSYFTEELAEPTRETDIFSRTTTNTSSRLLSLATEASILELPMTLSLSDSVKQEVTDLQQKHTNRSLNSPGVSSGAEKNRNFPIKMYLKNEDTAQARMGEHKILPSSPFTTNAVEELSFGNCHLQPDEDESCSNKKEVSAVHEKNKERDKDVSDENRLATGASLSSQEDPCTRYVLDKTTISKAEITSAKVNLAYEEEEVLLETQKARSLSKEVEFPSQKVKLTSDQILKKLNPPREGEPSAKQDNYQLLSKLGPVSNEKLEPEPETSKQEVLQKELEPASKEDGKTTAEGNPSGKDDTAKQKEMPKEVEPASQEDGKTTAEGNPSGKDDTAKQKEMPKEVEPASQEDGKTTAEGNPSGKDDTAKQKEMPKEVEPASQGVGKTIAKGNPSSKKGKAKWKCPAEIQVKAMVHWDSSKMNKFKETEKEEDTVSFDTKL